MFNVTLKADDQQGSQGLGTLSTVNGSENATQLNVTAVKLANGNAMAFAVYNAPPDFSRGGNDDTAYSRTIDITAVSEHPKATSCGGMTILRPPLVLVHGLWADNGAWDAFVAGNSAILGAYFVRRAGYALPFPLEVNAPLTPDTYPTALRVLWSSPLTNLKANSMGLATTAPMVSAEIQGFIQEFKKEKGAAAIQADVIGHSMGGLVTRTLVKSPDFTQFLTFGKGYVHKLITIGTPHQGSPLATALGTESDNSCTRNFMAAAGNVSIDAVSLGGTVVDGAILDLIPGNQNVSSGNNSVPTGMIAGSASAANLIGLDTSSRPMMLRALCSNDIATFDSLPESMTSANWPQVMGGESDGIVPLTSEFNGASTAPGGAAAVPGIVHSKGALELGLIGPIELDLGGSISGVGDQLFKLLNAPVAGDMFRMLP